MTYASLLHRASLAVSAIVLISLVAAAPAMGQAPRAKSMVELTADSLLGAGNAKAAREIYQRLVNDDPGFLRAWNSLATASLALGDVASAAVAYERAAAGGRIVTAIYNAGAMHSRLGHLDKAFEWLDRSVAAGFNQPGQFNSDADLAAMRKDPRWDSFMQRVIASFEPCRHDPDARRFDFWLGEWNVTPVSAPTFKVGSSVVQRVSGGCALLENWTASNGGEGKSLNAFNTQTSQWQQYWVGQTGGVVEFRTSTWDGPTLVFRTTEGTRMQRLSFTPVDSNTVRQFGETSADSGKTWQVSYDFHYHRKR